MWYMPPYSVLLPLTQLLGGKFPSYSSFERYATVGFDEILGRQICYHCHLSSDEFQRWSPISRGIHEDWDWTYSSSTAGEKANPSLEASVENWLAGKADRRRQVKESIERSLKRGIEFGYCEACNTQQGWVVVTEYFLDSAWHGKISPASQVP
ncbi:hypothetical protein FRC18_002500 [Serendipita sp. 400]|nr:hypothetical protein FRC18_002500 [Serendipita sp. 400]